MYFLNHLLQSLIDICIHDSGTYIPVHLVLLFQRRHIYTHTPLRITMATKCLIYLIRFAFKSKII